MGLPKSLILKVYLSHCIYFHLTRQPKIRGGVGGGGEGENRAREPKKKKRKNEEKKEKEKKNIRVL